MLCCNGAHYIIPSLLPCIHGLLLQVITPKEGQLFGALRKHCPILFENYWPTMWGYNTHITSIFRAKFQRGVEVKYTRYHCTVLACRVCNVMSTHVHSPHHTTPHHTTPHRTAPHHTAPHHTAPHHTTPHRTIMLYCANLVYLTM